MPQQQPMQQAQHMQQQGQPMQQQGQYAQAQSVQYGQPVYNPQMQQGQMQQGQMQQGQMQQGQVITVQQTYQGSQGQGDCIVGYEMGPMAWCMVVLLIFIFWPLCWIPCVCESCQEPIRASQLGNCGGHPGGHHGGHHGHHGGHHC